MATGPGAPAEPARVEAVRRQVELCRLGDLVLWEAVDPAPGVDSAVADGARLTMLLLAAATTAVQRGLHRVVWPVQLGGCDSGDPLADLPRLEQLASVCDRALLVGQLVELELVEAESRHRGVQIETPYLDFSDRQMMDLALDVDAPTAAADWCQAGEPGPCGQCAACRRWGRALEQVRPCRHDAGGLAVADVVVTIGPRGERGRKDVKLGGERGTGWPGRG